MYRFKVEADGAIQAIAEIHQTAERPVKLFKRIQRHQQAESGLMFRRLAKGGTARGVTWPWFSDAYVRRPSGQPVTPASNLLRDTGAMAAGVSAILQVFSDRMELHTPISHARYHQAQEPKPDRTYRPFAFFTDADTRLYAQWAAEELLDVDA